MSLRNASDLTQRKTDQTKYFDHVRLRAAAVSGALGKALVNKDFVDIVNGGTLFFDTGGNVVGCHTCPVVSGGGGGNTIINPFQWSSIIISSNTWDLNTLSFGLDYSDDSIYIAGDYQGQGSANNMYIYNSDNTYITNQLPFSSNNGMYSVKYTKDGIFSLANGIVGGSSGIAYTAGGRLANDSYNNTYISGIYKGTSNNINIYNANQSSYQSNILPTSTLNSIYFTKFDKNGNALFACAIDSMSNNDINNDIKIDGENNCYVSGSYRGISSNTYIYSSNQSSISSNVLPTTSSSGVYIVKFDENGSFKYTCALDGSGVDATTKLSINNNNVYATGDYRNTTSNDIKIYSSNMSTITSNILPSVTSGSFLVKFNDVGSLQYACGIKHDVFGQYMDVTTDNNSVYILGRYDGTSSNIIVYNSNMSASYSNVLPTSDGLGGTFILKYNINGTFDKAVGIIVNGPYASYIEPTSICATDNNIYISGYYQGTSNHYNIATSNGVVNSNVYLPSSVYQTGFYAKFDKDLNFKYSTAIVSDSNIVITKITTDSSQENIYVSGAYCSIQSNYILASNASFILNNKLLTTKNITGEGSASFLMKFKA